MTDPVRSVERVLVTRIVVVRGRGTPDSVIREVTQWWADSIAYPGAPEYPGMPSRNLIGEYDPCPEAVDAR